MKQTLSAVIVTCLLCSVTPSPIAVGKQPAASNCPVRWPESYLRRSGEVRIPVLAVQFQGDAEPFPAADLEPHLFEDRGQGSSLTDYYREVSYDRFILRGDVHGWFALSEDHAHYHQGCGGTCPKAYESVARLIEEAVQQAQAAGIDFSRYDNDGDDGQPDSGDDDGFVDLLILVHSGREDGCRPAGGTPIQGVRAHEQKFWNVSNPSEFLGTGTTGNNGKEIVVNEFILVPGRTCDGTNLSPIGPFAHEVGHALGLPDLVDQDYSSGGIGWWSLMAEGSYGGDGASPDIPTHLSAWAKARLGWLEPRKVRAASGGDQTLSFVEDHPDAILVPFEANSRRCSHYYLLEARSKTGFDQRLPGSGLLVWRINDTAVDTWNEARRCNRDLSSVNDEDTQKGVVLIEADGRNDLAAQTWLSTPGCMGLPGCSGSGCCSAGGDAGDPFPGSSQSRCLNDRSTPRSFGGVALCEIRLSVNGVSFSLNSNGTCANCPTPP